MSNNFIFELGAAPGTLFDKRMLMNYFIGKGMTGCRDHLKMDEDDQDDFIAALKLQFEDVKVFDYRKHTPQIVIESKTFGMSINRNEVTIAATSYEVVQDILTRFESFFVTKDKGSISVYYYYLTKGEICYRYITINPNDVSRIYPEFYPDVDPNKLCEAFDEADESILVLYGDPGVGKTTFLKLLLKQGQYKSVAYIKDMEVMCNGEFWSSIAENNFDLMIFDDLDFALKPRSEGDKGFVTNLLSYSDGIFNRRSKIVITTNQPISKMDSALVRPGRCFDFLVLQPMTFEQGRKVWTEILEMSGDIFDELYNGSDKVTQAAIMSDYRRLHNEKLERTYVRSGSRKYSIEQKLAQEGIGVVANGTRTGFGME